MTVTDGCTYDELEAIFVPADKIELVKSLLPKGKDKVRDISVLEDILDSKLESTASLSIYT
ncbi:hypothetical protein ACQUW5_06845 [Legionella sp. CNM-1927-20]|uniref:hypothetical protein n=1 Tax=Legionella sp. CNM-1927-20 TaxID=3422221 RepID=UPI00403AA0A6